MTDQELAPDWLEALRAAEKEILRIQDRVMKTVKDRAHAQAMADALVVAEHCVMAERRRIETQVDEATDMIEGLLLAASAEERAETWQRLRSYLRCSPTVIRGVEERLHLIKEESTDKGDDA